MMKNPKNLLIFAVLGGIVGTGLGFIGGRWTAKTDVNWAEKSNMASILSVLDAQEKAWNNGDIEGFMNGYLKSDHLRFASGGDITSGWQETLNRYRARYSDRAKMGTLKFDIKTVDVLDEDDSLVFGQWTLIREQDEPTGLFTLHLKKENDDWVIVSDHTSSAD